jgi:hypothetical protein
MKIVNQLWYNYRASGLVALPDNRWHMKEIGLNPDSFTKVKCLKRKD